MKVQDINPFGVRMPAELKQKLDFEAKKGGRSLNNEVVTRLWDSINEGQPGAGRHEAREPRGNRYSIPLTDAEKAMLAVFRRLPAEKQLALISLFK